MRHERLWTPHDSDAVQRLRAATGEDRLFDALLAIEGASAEDRASADAVVQGWADLVRQRVAAAPGCPDLGSRVLREVVADEGALRGDGESYDAPENSLVTQVLSRRRGQPILVSSVWLEVGRRAGITVEGVGLPGHFVARVGGEGGQLVDPFAGGKPLSVQQCARIVRAISGGSLPWDASYLQPTSAQQIAERVLRNLVRARRCCADVAPLYRAVRLYAELRDDDPEAALVHAGLAEQLGAFRLAEGAYRAIADRFPGSAEAEAAERRARDVARRVRALH